MTISELETLGFKKEKLDDGFWFELNTKTHLFITNDSLFNSGKDQWNIGYQHKKNMDDIFWFNNQLKDQTEFKIIFKVLTKKELL